METLAVVVLILLAVGGWLYYRGARANRELKRERHSKRVLVLDNVRLHEEKDSASRSASQHLSRVRELAAERDRLRKQLRDGNSEGK